MNKFKYLAHVKQLENCKYVNELGNLIREHEAAMPKCRYFEQSYIYNYKLLSLGLKLFANRSSRTLPQFIYKTYKDTHERCLKSLLEAHLTDKSYRASVNFTETPSYSGFMDWFEFDTLINLPQSTWYVEQLNSIIGNQSAHFNIRFNYKTNSFDSKSTDLPTAQQMLTYAIRYKQVNFPNKLQTVWDMFIADCKSKATTPVDVSTDVTKLEQQIKALQTLGDYYGSTI